MDGWANEAEFFYNLTDYLPSLLDRVNSLWKGNEQSASHERTRLSDNTSSEEETSKWNEIFKKSWKYQVREWTGLAKLLIQTDTTEPIN